MINIAVVKNLMVRAGADFSGLYKETQKAQKTLQTFSQNVNRTMRFIGTTLAALGIGKLIKDATKVAMEVESAINQVNRTMQGNAGEFAQWANEQAKAYGMARSEAFKYGAVYSNLISGFTKDTAETAKYTQELLKASAVVASATGRTMEDVLDRIRSGLLGNTEAIEDLGINVQVNMLESTNAFRRFAGDKSWQQLDFQTQQQIRLMAILEQATAKYGTVLADTTATRQMQFIASLKNIQLMLGQAFLPIYNAVLPALTAMANAIGKVVNLIAQFMTALFGAPKQAQTQAAAIQSQASAMQDLGAATTGAGKAAKKAAKDAKGALAGFDEITQVTQKTTAGVEGGAGGGTAGGGVGTGGVSVPVLDTGGFAESTVAISEKVKEFVGQFKTLLAPAAEAAQNLVNAFRPLAENIGAGLKWLLDNVLIPLGKWTMTEVVPRFLNILAEALKVVNSVIETLKPLGQWLWDNFLQPLAQWTGGVIVDVLDKIQKGLSAISNWIKENKPAVETFTIIVGGFAAAWWLVNAAVTAWNVIAAIATKVTAAFGAVVGFLTSPIGIAVAIIGTLIAVGVLLWKNWDTVKSWLINIWNAIKTTAVLVFSAVGSFFSNIWNSIKTTAINVWNGIKSFFSNLWGGIKNTAASIFNSIKNSIINTFNGLKTGISNIWNSIWGTIKGVINWIIKGINTMINALNKISIKVPSVNIPLVGKVGGFTIGLPKIPTIPYLAQGGIVTSPTLAMVGEAGAEAVMPLERNTGWIDILASKLASAMQGVQLAGAGDIYVYVGNEQVESYIYRSQNRRNIRSNGR